MIAVIIPSLNEQDNISFLTRQVDIGLQKYFKNLPATIINVDSHSKDRTKQVFLATKTVNPKVSLNTPYGKRGKGYGLLEGFKYGLKNKAKYFLLIDADLKSIRPIWIKKLLQPVLNRISFLTLPLYTRNRYEGNTTNHFCSPLIYSCFNKDIPQPIGGDFCLSSNLVKAVLKEVKIRSDFLYGIDILITLTAIKNKYPIIQKTLGKKIHNPSFSKIIPTSTGAISSSFGFINRHRNPILKSLIKQKPCVNAPLLAKVVDSDFSQKPQLTKIKKLQKLATRLIKKYEYSSFISKKIIEDGKAKRFYLNSELWTDILSDYLVKLLTEGLTDEKVNFFARSLIPLYLLRVLTYFEEIKNLNNDKIEKIIKEQKQLLRVKLIMKLKKL